jgi:hypothetical protein
MPRAGQVRIVLCRDDAAATSFWLLNSYASESFGGDADAEQSAKATALGELLGKMSRRRRRAASFTTLIDRELAAWLGAKAEAVIVLSCLTRVLPVPRRVFETMVRFKEAAIGRRGRPALAAKAVEERAQGHIRHMDLRHRKRMLRRSRYERAWAAWNARGNTIAGSAGTDDPMPKK